MSIIVYTKQGCPFCVKVKEFLDTVDLRYKTVDLTDDDERSKFYEEHLVNTVPQVFVNGLRIGGYTEVLAWHELQDSGRERTKLREFSKAFKPFNYPWANDMTVRHERAHWIEQEADLSEDVAEWKSEKITPIEKEYITNILRLFTQSDVAVGQNYFDQFIPIFLNNEVRNMLSSFATREGIHQRAYALLNETLGLPEEEYHAFLEYKEMADKLDFMRDSNLETDEGIALALAKSVFNEGVSLFASFVMLLNFQRQGKMKGMGKVVEWSIRDESLIKGTLVVTEKGSKPIETITLDDKVLQFDINTKEFSYVHPSKTQEVFRDESYLFTHPYFNQHVSPNHRMIYEENGKIKECVAKEFFPSSCKYFLIVNKDKHPLSYRRVNSLEVHIQKQTHYNVYTPFYCLSVPGGSFVVRDGFDNDSVTGNTMHVEGISNLFRTFCKENSHIINDPFKKKIYNMARDIVKLEDKFVELAYSLGEIEGLSSEDVKLYIRYITDRRLVQLGLKPNFEIEENPLEWLEWILNGADHTNFFEGRVTEYDVSGAIGNWEEDCGEDASLFYEKLE